MISGQKYKIWFQDGQGDITFYEGYYVSLVSTCDYAVFSLNQYIRPRCKRDYEYYVFEAGKVIWLDAIRWIEKSETVKHICPADIKYPLGFTYQFQIDKILSQHRVRLNHKVFDDMRITNRSFTNFKFNPYETGKQI